VRRRTLPRGPVRAHSQAVRDAGRPRHKAAPQARSVLPQPRARRAAGPTTGARVSPARKAHPDVAPAAHTAPGGTAQNHREHHCLQPLPFQQFQVLFHSLFKVLFIFPSRYLFAIGLLPVFSFRWNLPPTLICNPKQIDSTKTPGTLPHASPERGFHPL